MTEPDPLSIAMDDTEEREWKAEYERSVAPYRIQPGSKSYPDGAIITSLDDAVVRLQSAVKWEISFDREQVVESENWWYIPFVWMGCSGYIVDKLDGYINQLGSCHPLGLCFWAHNRNIKYDYADLTVNQVYNLDATLKTLIQMGNRSRINPIPNKPDAGGERTEFWTEEELEEKLKTLPVTFPNQQLWFTIRALKQSCDNDEFEFVVSRGAWQVNLP